MSTKSSSINWRGIIAGSIIPVALIVSVCLFIFVFGNSDNFMGGSNKNQPLQGNFYGLIYKGGPVVSLILALLLSVLAYSVERFIAVSKATGKGKVPSFVRNINALLKENKLEEAKDLCNKQKGSVANVIHTGLEKYQEMERDTKLTKEQKVVAIQKEIEEATSLELPSLQQNLVVLSTAASLGTLLGLLGTVIGMIRAFSALATAGAPDSVALSNGISEALINTASGIGTAALAIIFYNIFTTKIEKLTYAIDEAGFTIVNTFSSKN